MSDTLRLGERGEALAWNYLKKQGYTLLEKNYRNHFGEIDVIAEKKRVLVFLEIKTRRHHHFGLPEEAIDWKKRRKLTQVAQAYLQAQGRENQPARFDVLALTWNGTEEPHFHLLEDAFIMDE